MRLSTTIDAIRAALLEERAKRKKIGFVPTMGALHQGHLALIDQAKQKSEHVVVSIFVNPEQFAEGEDFDAYPRNLDGDRILLESAGVDHCFAPDTREMWPQGHETIVETRHLGNILLGALRPGHFRGVTSVVAKLFNIIQPDCAFFGEKDFQQLAIIRRMVKDLNFPIEIIGVPIAREADGVAQSSRNVLLSPDERRGAAIIPQACAAAAQLYGDGERCVQALIAVVRNVLMQEKLAMIEAIDMRDCETLAEVDEKLERPSVLLLTVRFGQVRLIDQQIFSYPEGAS